MNAADEIEKLHGLLTKGAITQEEFESAKARILAGSPAPKWGGNLPINQLRLSDDDKWVAGVCGGLAQATKVESWVWRLLFALGVMFGGVTVLIYILLWVFVPRDSV